MPTNQCSGEPGIFISDYKIALKVDAMLILQYESTDKLYT